MIPSALFARYAKSLADVVLKEGDEPTVTANLTQYLGIFDAVPDLLDAFKNPAIPREVKEAILARLLELHPVAKETGNFLRILLEHNRLHYYREIHHLYLKIVNERKGIVAASVTAAVPLSEHERSRLQDSLAKVIGKQVALSMQTDPDLIGGVVVQIGSVLYDGSIRRHLTEMKERLKGA